MMIIMRLRTTPFFANRAQTAPYVFMSHAFFSLAAAWRLDQRRASFKKQGTVFMALMFYVCISRVHLFPHRAIHGQEFDTWATTLLNVLQSRDRSTTCLTYLRQLLVLTSVTKYNRKY